MVAGTQNENGFTGVEDTTVEQYFEREKKDFEMTVRIPLPSFAGKERLCTSIKGRNEAVIVYYR